MDSAQYLARIDALCSADLTAEHSAPEVVVAGPGYRVVALEVSHGLWTGDAALRGDGVEDFHALKELISQELDERWPEQHPRWGMLTLRTRIDRGEEIPEPWETVCLLVDELDLWRPDGQDRWIALGVADRDPDDEVQLLAVASETDPV